MEVGGGLVVVVRAVVGDGSQLDRSGGRLRKLRLWQVKSLEKLEEGTQGIGT